MVDKNIQFKQDNGSGFDKLYPATKSEVVDVKGVTLDDKLNTMTNDINGNKSTIGTLTTKVSSLENSNTLLYDEI